MQPLKIIGDNSLPRVGVRSGKFNESMKKVRSDINEPAKISEPRASLICDWCGDL